MNSPAVAAVSLDVLLRHHPAFLESSREFGGFWHMLAGHPQRSYRRCQSSASSRPSRSVLLAKQILRLRRPRHQFAIKAQPISCKLVPQTRLGRRCLNATEELPLQHAVVEEPPASPRVADADLVLRDPESTQCCVTVAANDHDRTRPHVLLLADHLLHMLLCESSRMPQPDAPSKPVPWWSRWETSSAEDRSATSD